MRTKHIVPTKTMLDLPTAKDIQPDDRLAISTNRNAEWKSEQCTITQVVNHIVNSLNIKYCTHLYPMSPVNLYTEYAEDIHNKCKMTKHAREVYKETACINEKPKGYQPISTMYRGNIDLYKFL